MKKLIIHAICGDEERWIKQWAESVLKVDPWKVVINLTQYGDNSENLIREHIPKDKLILLKHPWEKDFSGARNKCIEYIREHLSEADWGLYLDFDETFTKDSIEPLKAIIQDIDRYPFLGLITIYNSLETKGLLASLYYPRLHPFKDMYGSLLELHYDGTVHNQLIISSDIPVIRVPVSIFHEGYALSSEEMTKKHKRSEELLRAQIEKDNDSFFPHLNLAQLLRAKGNFLETEEHAREVLRICEPRVSSGDKRYTHALIMAWDQIGTSLLARKKYLEAAEASKTALEIYPKHLDSLLNIGNCYLEVQNFDEAILWYKRYLFVRTDYDEMRDNTNIILNHLNSSHIVLYNLGIAFALKNDMENSIKYFKKSYEEEPTFRDCFIKYLNGLRLLGKIDILNEETNTFVEKYPDLAYKVYTYYGLIAVEECHLELAKFHFYQSSHLVPSSSDDFKSVRARWEEFKNIFGDIPGSYYDTSKIKAKTQKVELPK